MKTPNNPEQVSENKEVINLGPNMKIVNPKNILPPEEAEKRSSYYLDGMILMGSESKESRYGYLWHMGTKKDKPADEIYMELAYYGIWGHAKDVAITSASVHPSKLEPMMLNQINHESRHVLLSEKISYATQLAEVADRLKNESLFPRLVDALFSNNEKKQIAEHLHGNLNTSSNPSGTEIMISLLGGCQATEADESLNFKIKTNQLIFNNQTIDENTNAKKREFIYEFKNEGYQIDEYILEDMEDDKTGRFCTDQFKMDMCGELAEEAFTMLESDRGYEKVTLSNINDQGFERLIKLDHIKELHLQSKQLSSEALTKITNLQNLTTLSIEYCNECNEEVIAEIAKLPHLEHLKLGSITVTPESIAHIATMTQLKSLDLSGGFSSTFGNNDIANLKQLPHLQNLNLNNNPNINTEILSILEEFPALNKLSIECRKIDPRELISWKGLGFLKQFNANIYNTAAAHLIAKRLMHEHPHLKLEVIKFS